MPRAGQQPGCQVQIALYSPLRICCPLAHTRKHTRMLLVTEQYDSIRLACGWEERQSEHLCTLCAAPAANSCVNARRSSATPTRDLFIFCLAFAPITPDEYVSRIRVSVSCVHKHTHTNTHALPCLDDLPIGTIKVSLHNPLCWK